MNPSSLKRAQDENEKTLAKCKEKIDEWEKHKKEYVALHEKMKTFADKVTHEMMIPLGPLALVPGRVIHTNEITVLLGDNWFALRSTKQACEIIQRRIKKCDDTLTKLYNEEENVKNWLEFAHEMKKETDDFVEIMEEYDEEKEKAWRAQHRKNVQKYRQELSKKKNINDPTESQASQLEDSVRLSSSSTSSTSFAETVSANPTAMDIRKRRVSWQDQSAIKLMQEHKDQGSTSSEEDEQTNPLMITFTHTEEPDLLADKEEDSDARCEDIESPSDIYVKFGHLFQKIPKSILKKRESEEPVQIMEFQVPTNAQKDQAEAEKVIPASSNEKISSSMSSKVLQEKVLEKPRNQETIVAENTRPISRFKAQRLRM